MTNDATATDTLFPTAVYKTRRRATAPPWYEQVPEDQRWFAQAAMVRAKSRHDEMAEIMDTNDDLGELYAEMVETRVLDCEGEFGEGPSYMVVHAADLAARTARWDRIRWKPVTVIVESPDRRRNDSLFHLTTFVYAGQPLGWALARRSEIFAHCETPL